MRTPDLLIGPRDNPQTSRWHLWKLGGFQIALHRWHRSDDDRALHDHKADNLSILLTGRLREIVGDLSTKRTYAGEVRMVHRRRTLWPFVPYFRRAETPHRIELIDGPVWTIWIRWPPRRRWGYWCKFGWRDADVYNKQADYYAAGVSEVGRGCD